MKKLTIIACSLLLLVNIAYTQQFLTLNEVIQLTQEKSIRSLLNNNEFLVAYWNYKMYRADRLPYLSANLIPLAYNKSVFQTYNVVEGKDEFREIYKLESVAGLSLSQNIDLTGGKISLSSNLYRMQNLFVDNDISYAAIPFMINYNQPLFGFNAYKWDKQIEPKRYEQAKKELIQDLQDLHVEAVKMFFKVVIAQNDVSLTKAEVATADTLLKFGRMQRGIANINREALLNLELNYNNAKVKLLQNREQLRKVEDNFRLFVGLTKEEDFILLMPGETPTVEITPEDALALAHMNNPDIFDLEINRLEAKKESDEAIKRNRYDINLDFSYGLNQQGNDIQQAYSDPLNRQMAMVSLQFPILDWGRNKRTVSLAKSREEIIEAQSKLQLQDIEQEIMSLAYQYALKDIETESTAIADSIAAISYELALYRFQTGEAGILELDDALSKKNAAKQQHITTLEKFWTLFYQLQSATLFDLRLKKKLSVDVDQMVD